MESEDKSVAGLVDTPIAMPIVVEISKIETGYLVSTTGWPRKQAAFTTLEEAIKKVEEFLS